MTAYRAFLVALIFVGLIVVGAVFVTLQAAETTAARTEAAGRLLLLERVKVSLLRSESTQRAYLLTGDGAYLQLSERNAADVVQHLDRLRAGGYAAHTLPADIAELHAAARGRIDSLREVIDTNGRDGPDRAQLLIRDRASADMDRYLTVSARIEQSETVHLQSLRDHSTVLATRLLWLLGLGAVLNLALLWLVYRVMRGDMRLKQQLIDRMEKSGDEIVHLNEMNSALLSCSDQQEANQVVRHYIRLLFPGTAGGLYLYRASRNLLELQATWGTPDGAVADSILSDECWSLRRGATHLHRGDDDLACTHVDPSGTGYCCVPMMALGETLGMLHTQCDSSDTERVRLIETVATQVASAMANLNLRAALHAQSIKDPLTGLFNRRYLEETVQRETLRALRNDGSMGVVILDIDHFKTFNDSHGHQAGDYVLQVVGEALRNAIRGDDIACRYGGEEFTLILPGATLEQAVQRAEQVRIAISQLPLHVGGRTLDAITISLGVASFPAHGNDWPRVLQAADAALYQAKQKGRNCVVTAVRPE
ncbi:MAG: diguanylate cyclase [Gammaproteobacteria bacterium]